MKSGRGLAGNATSLCPCWRRQVWWSCEPRPGSQVVALAAELQNVTSVNQPVQGRSGESFAAENFDPVLERQGYAYFVGTE